MAREKYSKYIVAIIIALAGLAFLSSAVYYLVYLPVPTPMQQLKTRVMMWLQLEEAKNIEEYIEIEDKENNN